MIAYLFFYPMQYQMIRIFFKKYFKNQTESSCIKLSTYLQSISMLLVTKLCFVFENSETVSFDIAAIQYYNRLSQCSHEQIKIHYNTLAKKTNLVCIWKTSKKWNQPKLCLKLNCDGNCSKQDIAWQLLMCIHSTSTDILVIFLIGSV